MPGGHGNGNRGGPVAPPAATFGLRVAARRDCRHGDALVRAAGPSVVPAYQGQLTITSVGTVAGHPTQIAWNPSTGLLYVMTTDQGPISFNYRAATGAITNPVQAAPQVKGIGIGFLGTNMYLTSHDGTIHKLADDNGNGVWGEAGELDVAIVTGCLRATTIPIRFRLRAIRSMSGSAAAPSTGTSALDQRDARRPGGKGFFYGGIGRTWGDSAYNGTIAWIQDLTAGRQPDRVRQRLDDQAPGLLASPDPARLRPVHNQGPGKLVVHSAGTRNPFGLCLDRRQSLVHQ